jgi:rRNA maturation endonuclease Nob1
MGIVGVELGFLAHSDPSNAPDILTGTSAQEIAVIGGVVFAVIGAVLVLMEFRGYRMCPACGKEIFYASLSACPRCGRQLPQRKGRGV